YCIYSSISRVFIAKFHKANRGGWLIHAKFKFDPREQTFQGWKYYPLPLPMENSLNHCIVNCLAIQGRGVWKS
ncbi:hypothetical protein LDENG_00233210, partial [Lucifuga dentata]